MKEYWFCIIGPVERKLIPDGGDLPMRLAVQSGLDKIVPSINFDELHTWSGWGITEAQCEKIMKALYSPE